MPGARPTGVLFDQHASAVREAYARVFRCSVDAFDSEQLTIVDLDKNATPATAMGVTFGTGTVLAIDPAYREFAEANPPSKHFRALLLVFLQPLVAEAARRGHAINANSPSLCFTLADEPPEVAPPAGFELVGRDAAWMNAEQQSARSENGPYENAAGEPGEGREPRNRFALTLHDASGEIVAIAGAFDTHGMLEIGVDVVRAQRGNGYGRLVVSAIAREIMKRGAVPFYRTPPTNIRSHRTAESCGFRIVCTHTFVSGPDTAP
jgi:GNAT superfamily N-acetyltransferase